jgi:hypothetical protein
VDEANCGRQRKKQDLTDFITTMHLNPALPGCFGYRNPIVLYLSLRWFDGSRVIPHRSLALPPSLHMPEAGEACVSLPKNSPDQ